MKPKWKPRQPKEGSRQDRFRPWFCPHEDCPDHTVGGREHSFVRYGFYRRKREPSRKIARFRCCRCRRTYASSSFTLSYRMQRRELLIPVAAMLNAGSAHRQIGRTLDCSKSTVTRISVKIGQHAILFQQKMMDWIDEIQEVVAYDHFETFVGDQTNRIAIGTAVGSRTGLVYDIRGVRYRAALKRAQHKRPLKTRARPTEPGRLNRSILETLQLLVSKAPDGLRLVSDDHPLYRQAVATINRSQPTQPRIVHSRFANPDRKPGHDRSAARARDRALFPVDALHKLLRHSHAHHRRETIAFARKEFNVVARTALFAVWRNFIKLVTERRPTTLTPAMKAGITDRAWTWAEVFSERLFERRIDAAVG